MKKNLTLFITSLLLIFSSLAKGQNHYSLPDSITEKEFIFHLQYDSTEIDTLHIRKSKKCSDLPNFIREKSKVKSETSGINLISFAVDSCVEIGKREKKTLGYKFGQKSTYQESTVTSMNMDQTNCLSKDTIYYINDTLFVYYNLTFECCKSFIADFEYLENGTLNLFYKSYSAWTAMCHCNYGLKFKLQTNGIKPKEIKIIEK